VHIVIEPTPIGIIGMDGTQDMAAVAGVLERLSQHDRVAVNAGDFETGLQQSNRTEVCTRGDVQDLPGFRARVAGR